MRQKRLHSPPDRNVMPFAVSAFARSISTPGLFSILSLRRRSDFDPDQLLDAEIVPSIYSLPCSHRQTIASCAPETFRQDNR